MEDVREVEVEDAMDCSMYFLKGMERKFEEVVGAMILVVIKLTRTVV